ncbi:PQQ-like beta-propeller repeat protein [Niabella pedocola]|uniref:PQQ-like beta-propeller repeat protein n=1 Tax=Niabella pedocola TaxID=1752077 RepID=A0ABS8PNW6_9BACT|nr:PQQ-like beta-propeller repeat protein [Niabella pedocola]MCD2422449.1 PQQ-like beta-propeller repeat protein [Niabella pedocola]
MISVSTLELPSVEQIITAEAFDSGFADAHDTYNAVTVAADGKVYYVLSSEKYNVAGRFFVFDPATATTRLIGNLSALCGEDETQCIAQGKSHVSFYEYGGKIFFATHVGYYELIDGMDRLPRNPPPGYELYRGGHLLAYDPRTGGTESLVLMQGGEGVVTMVMDTTRGHIFCISWPTGNFIFYDVKTGRLRNKGRLSGEGEGGTPGKDFRSLCRSLVVDPGNGKVYASTADGAVWCYDPLADRLFVLEHMDLKRDYFGTYNITQPGSMAYNWRKVLWYPQSALVYGVHGNSGYLFAFDPVTQDLALGPRLTSGPSKRSGMYDQFSYGYLGFTLGPDNETIYYLTGGPIYEKGKLVKGVRSIAKGAARGPENLHLVTYHIPTEYYQDHGPVFYADGGRPAYVNAIAVSADGYIYTIARVTRNGKTVSDLIRFRIP